MHRRILFASLLLTLVVAVGVTPHVLPQPSPEPDEQFLRAVGIAPDTPTLLDFFRRRTLKNAEPMPRIEPAVERDATAAAARLLAVRPAARAVGAVRGVLPRGEDDL